MVIGRHEPKQAMKTTFKEAIAIGLDEALTALEESFHDLTDEQAWSKALPGRHNITTIVMHLLMSVDVCACRFQTGRAMMQHEDRFDIWTHSEQELRGKQGDLPTVADMLSKLRGLRQAAVRNLEQATEEDLLGPRSCEQWWTETGRTSADAFMRVIGHTQAHVRQIWLMRGAMALTDKDGWPQQHWA